MRNVLDVLRTEYQTVLKQADGSHLTQVLSSLFCFVVGAAFLVPKQSVQSFIEARHVGILVSNVVYVVGLLAGVTSMGLAFCLGGASAELMSLATNKLPRRLLVLGYVFSSVLMYGCYIVLLGTKSLPLGVGAGVGLGSTAVGVELYFQVGREVAVVLSSSSLISIGVTGVSSYLLESRKGVFYLEEVSIFLVLGVFIGVLVNNLKNFPKRVERLQTEESSEPLVF